MPGLTLQPGRGQKLLWPALVRQQQGTALIETSLTIGVFMLLMLGFMNFALILYGTGNLTYGSKLAVRYDALHSNASASPATTASIKSIVSTYAPGYPSNTTVTTVAYTANNVVGSTVTVTVKATYTIKLPLYTFSALAVSTSASAVITQ